MSTPLKIVLGIAVVIILVFGFLVLSSFMQNKETTMTTTTQKETRIETEQLPPSPTVIQPITPGPAEWVTKSPPELQAEAQPAPPTPQHVWIQGYWTYDYNKKDDDNWVWVPGKYALPPRTGQVWIPGEWRKNPNGASWSWTEGSWK